MTRTGVIIIAFTIALALLTAILIMAQFGAPLPLDEIDVEIEYKVEPEQPKREYIVDKPAPELAYPITQAERDLIAETVHHEAKGEGVAGMAAVTEVILNRLQDGRFGKSVESVCTPGQFHGLKKAGTETVTQNAYAAVSRVFDEGLYAGTCGALYFCTPDTDPNDIKPGIVEVARIGRHVFYID